MVDVYRDQQGVNTRALPHTLTQLKGAAVQSGVQCIWCHLSDTHMETRKCQGHGGGGDGQTRTVGKSLWWRLILS